jgi:phosphoglucosamine mutase
MSELRKLFGTDGIRGVAGEYPLDTKTIYATGVALARLLRAGNEHLRILLGADTRESSAWIAAVIAEGLQVGGAEVANAGVVTTPGVAYLTHKNGFAAGIVISASHNPWRDNGIKVFGSDGYKLPDEIELEIEAEIFRQIETAIRADNPFLAPASDPRFVIDYGDYLRKLFPALDLTGLHLVVDCANGAASAISFTRRRTGATSTLTAGHCILRLSRRRR